MVLEKSLLPRGDCRFNSDIEKNHRWTLRSSENATEKLRFLDMKVSLGHMPHTWHPTLTSPCSAYHNAGNSQGSSLGLGKVISKVDAKRFTSTGFHDMFGLHYMTKWEQIMCCAGCATQFSATSTVSWSLGLAHERAPNFRSTSFTFQVHICWLPTAREPIHLRPWPRPGLRPFGCRPRCPWP